MASSFFFKNSEIEFKVAYFYEKAFSEYFIGSEIKEYSEQLTRELVSRVIVYEDKVAIEFKAGLQVKIDE